MRSQFLKNLAQTILCQHGDDKNMNPFTHLKLFKIPFCIVCILLMNSVLFTDEVIEYSAPVDVKYGNMNIDFVFLATGEIYPAYIDHKNKVAYLWKEVRLNFKDIEFSPAFSVGTPITAAENKYILKDVYPIVVVLSDGDVNYLGFLDVSSGMFYRWKGLNLSKVEIPAEYKKNVINKKKLNVTIFDIPIPPRFWNLLSSQPSVNKEYSNAENKIKESPKK